MPTVIVRGSSGPLDDLTFDPLKPTPTNNLRGGEQRVVTFNPQNESIPIIYGSQRVGGAPWYWQIKASTQRFLLLYVVCNGPVNAISNVMIDGQTLAKLGLVNGTDYEIHLGTNAQTLSPIMAAQGAGTWTSALPGLAYVVVYLKTPTTTVPGVDPNRFQCDVQGLLVRDPRTDPTLVNRYYRDNPALCLADFMASVEYGAEIADANIDWTGTLTDSANFCDYSYPAAPNIGAALARTTGGTATAGVKQVAVTFVNAGLESNASPLGNSISFSANDKMIVASVPTGPGGTTARILYSTKAGGTALFKLPPAVQALFADNVTTGATFDPGPDSGFGVAPPSNFVGARYRIGMAIQSQNTLDSWIKTVRAHAQLFVAYNSGIFQIVADQVQAASGIVLTDQGVGANILKGATLRVKGASERPSHLVVRFVDSANSYKDSTAEENDPGIATNTVQEVSQVYDLFGCPAYDMARRLGIYLINRNVQDKEVTIPVNAEGAQILPGNVVSVTSLELNVAGQLVIVTECTPNGLGWTIKGEFYSASTYSDVLQTTVVTVPPASAPPYNGYLSPPGLIDSSLGGTLIFWAAPIYYYNIPTYDSTFWTNSGYTNYDGTKVNDADETVLAFTVPAGSATRTLTLDLGVGVTKDFRACRIASNDSRIASLFTVQWSNDNVSYTPIASSELDDYTGDPVNFPTPFVTELQWVSAGAHRYWQIISTFYGTTVGISEVRFLELNAAISDPFVDHYEVWDDGQGRTPRLLSSIPARLIPTITRPLDVVDALYGNQVSVSIFSVATNGVRSSRQGKLYVLAAVDVKAVPKALMQSSGSSSRQTGIVSSDTVDGATVQGDVLVLPSGGLVLVNGDNNNVAAVNSANRITGPTLAYAVTGIALPANGKEVTLINTVNQTLTLRHESVSSTAANRLKLPGGANISLGQDQGATFWYDSTDNRWRFTLFASGSFSIGTPVGDDEIAVTSSAAGVAQLTLVDLAERFRRLLLDYVEVTGRVPAGLENDFEMADQEK